MPLRSYRKKRNFELTAEPYGDKNKNKRVTQGLFVIQKHAASHLHYDFRLELDGVLKSWAVPKGPSLDPSVKRLAVHVEDHPIEYGSFEGIIPKGQYGGGTVMLWDQGTWIENKEAGKGYHKGNISFTLKGKKLKGEWKLIQLKNDPKNWLLIKVKDKEAKNESDYNVLEKKPLSIVSKKSMAQIEIKSSKTWNSNKRETASSKSTEQPSSKTTASISKQVSSKITSTTSKVSSAKSKNGPHVKISAISHAAAKKIIRSLKLKQSSIPKIIHPQLCTLVKKIPTDDHWLHELKFDGYRLICTIKDEIKLTTRGGLDWTHKFINIIQSIEKLKLHQCVLDGEIVVLNENNQSNFQSLQNAIHEHIGSPIIYYVFDVLYYDGFDLTDVPLLIRKEVLQKLLPPSQSGNIRYSDHVIGHGELFLRKLCTLGLEGVVSKKLDSPYFQQRTKSWVKTKCINRQEFVVGGYTLGQGSRQHLGSLILGYYENNNLIYCGHVGTGFNDASLKEIYQFLKKNAVDASPFQEPFPKNKGNRWVKPKMVVEVEFREWTSEGILRHPSFKGIREDKSPKSITRESPKNMNDPKLLVNSDNKNDEKGNVKYNKEKSEENNKTPSKIKKTDKNNKESLKILKKSDENNFELSHPDKTLYPKANITKLQIAQYYNEIKDWILPYIVNRPLSLLRCPNGNEQACFFQKHLNNHENKNSALFSIDIKDEKEPYITLKNFKGLIQLVQMGVLEIHPWGAKADKPDKPDWMILDLDPDPEVPWRKVIDAAYLVKKELEDYDLQSFVKTTGGKGLHVVVPLSRSQSWDDVNDFSKMFAQYIVSQHGDDFIATMSKAKRRGKIFIDYLRNHKGSTAIAPYSTRAMENATVSMPLGWNELNVKVRSDDYNIDNTVERLKQLKNDPWEGFFRIRQKLPKLDK